MKFYYLATVSGAALKAYVYPEEKHKLTNNHKYQSSVKGRGYLAAKIGFFLSLFWAGVTSANDGNVASDLPWVVRLFENVGVGSKLCAGSAVSPRIIVSAKHCEAKTAFYNNRTELIARHQDVPGTNIRLFVLVAPHQLSNYAKLGKGFASGGVVKPKEIGTTYGFSSTAFREQRRSDVSVRTHTVFNNEEYLVVSPLNGGIEPGDSGGPLVVKDEVVGVLRGKIVESTDPAFRFDGVAGVRAAVDALDYSLRARAHVAAEF